MMAASGEPDVTMSESADFLSGGGAMGALMRAFDWTTTPLGAPEQWPVPLRTVLRILLTSHHPLFIFWGPERRCFYNDAYARSLGPEKHPAMLGAKGGDMWPEIWHIIGPQIESVIDAGGSTWHENALVPILRHGRHDEVYWTYGYSPIDDSTAPGGVGGALVICTETTQTVLAERRHAFLVKLDDALRNQADAERIVATAVEALGRHLCAARVGYGMAEPDGLHITLATNFTAGVAPLTGRFALADFGARNIESQRTGRTTVCDDVLADPDQDPAVWSAIDTRAFVSVPLVRDGRLRASLFVNDRAPREWSTADVELIEAAARRIWEALERARAEAGLRASEEELRTVLDVAPVPVWIAHDPDCRWITGNGCADALIGVPRGMNVSLSAPADAAPPPYAVYRGGRPAAASDLPAQRAVRTRRAVPAEAFEFVTHDGRRLSMLLAAMPLFDARGAVRGAVVAGADVTELQRAQSQIAERERWFAGLANAMPQLAWAETPEGRHEYFNRGWYEYTGLSETESMARDCWSVVVHPEDLSAIGARWRHSMEAGVPYEAELRIRRHDGVHRWFLARAIADRDDDGRIQRWFGTCTDIDATKRIEEDLRRTEAALRAADRRKDVFLATLAHELRNPLAPIRTAAHVLDTRDLSAAHLARCRAIIVRQASHMASLLDDLLDVSRITRGALVLRRERIALRRIVDAAVETAQPLLDARRHELLIELPRRLPLIDADPVRLTQVLSNLLTNAAKYTDPGGTITVGARLAPHALELFVRDTGIGLAPELLMKVFEMFAQVGPLEERAAGGLGVGLALARGLLALHGGHIEARSEGPGRGCEFVATFPTVLLHPSDDGPEIHGEHTREHEQRADGKARIDVVTEEPGTEQHAE
jgi:PAS domain S-box-containing protein